MPKFKISFERDYTITEGFTRVIDAPSLAEAMAASETLAVEFNHDSPDDCSELEHGRFELGDYIPRAPAPAESETVTEAPDYTILPDGQCVPGNGDEALLELADQKHAAQMADLEPSEAELLADRWMDERAQES